MSAAKKNRRADGVTGAGRASRGHRLRSDVRRKISSPADPRATALDRYLRDSTHATLTREEEAALSMRIDEAMAEAVAAIAGLGLPIPEVEALAKEEDPRVDDRASLRRAARLERKMCALRNTLRLGRFGSARREALESELDLLNGKRARAIDDARLGRIAMDAIVTRLVAMPVPEASGAMTKERHAQLRMQLAESLDRSRRARHELAEHNLRLVVAIAKRYLKLGLPLGDLVQEGNIGLLRAVDRFDHRRGVRFSTYAVWWIKQALHHALSDQGRAIRIPQYVANDMAAIQRAKQRLRAGLGREPRPEEIATETGLSVEALRRCELADVATQPLDAPAHPQSEVPIVELLSSDRDPSRVANTLEDRRLAEQLLDHLSPRERRVLRLRLGFEDGRPRSLREVGEELGLTAERVRQIQAGALTTLRELVRS